MTEGQLPTQLGPQHWDAYAAQMLYRSASGLAIAPFRHADPARASLLLPYRLAAAVGGDPFPPRQGSLRGLRASAWAKTVWHLGDGRWWDAQAGSWRDGAGRVIYLAVGEGDVLGSVRTTRVVLAAAHRNHDTADNRDVNLMAVCQRCHMNHDRPEHKRRRWRTLFRRKASGDLFGGPYI